MKKIILSAFTLLALTFPISSNAQDGHVYVVLEAGSTKNSMALSSTLASLQSEDNSGGSFGAALGYRSILDSGLVLGGEISIASSSGTSSVADNFDNIVVDTKHITGLHGLIGFAFGEDQNAMIYGLIGIGGTKADVSTTNFATNNTTTISDNGEGFSFGGAFEYSFTDQVGIRVKALHTKYKGDIPEIKIRDTSVLAGLVFSF